MISADGDGDDGEVVGAQAQRRDAEDQAEDDPADEDQRDRRPQRPAVLGDRHGDGVGPDGGEAGLAEVEQAGVAEVHVEADGDQARSRWR